MRRVVALLCSLALVVASAEAQRQPKPPKRPRLSAGADTNDASAYLQHGHKVLETNQDAAMGAYYWAVRLDPASAEALYSLRTATLMRRSSTFQRYMAGNTRTVFSAEMRSNDSLYFRALQIDPFLHPRHEKTVLQHFYRAVIGDGINQGEIDFYLERQLNASSPALRARLAVAEGQFGHAGQLYNESISAAKDPMALYIERAKLNAMQGFNEAALADYTFAIARLKARDLKKDNVVVFYASKALHEHSVGLLHLRLGDAAKAREAFGRAMEEDLAFYPAHVELARLALSEHDSVTAASEAALAADLAPTEAYVHVAHGEVLAALGQHAEAAAAFRKATELEPRYAQAHYLLGMALDKSGDAAAASAALETFLDAAPRRHPERSAVTARVSALRGAAK